MSPTNDAEAPDNETEQGDAVEQFSLESIDSPDFELTLRASIMAGLILRDDLTGIVLIGQKLPGLRLEQRDLRGADFMRANLSQARLFGANLTGARLTNTFLDAANFGQANLSEAEIVYSSAVKTDFQQANLERADLHNTFLMQGKLHGARLQQANLSGTRLQEADLSHTNLTEVDFTGANLLGANLTGANLTGANFTKARITGACFDGTTWDPSKAPTASGKPFIPLRWEQARDGNIPPGAEAGGHEGYGDPQLPLYVARGRVDGAVHIGKVRSGFSGAHLPVKGAAARVSTYEALLGTQHWAAKNGGNVPPNAFEAGQSTTGQPIYVARGQISGGVHIGELVAGAQVAIVPFGLRAVELNEYEILVTQPPA